MTDFNVRKIFFNFSSLRSFNLFVTVCEEANKRAAIGSTLAGSRPFGTSLAWVDLRQMKVPNNSCVSGKFAITNLCRQARKNSKVAVVAASSLPLLSESIA